MSLINILWKKLVGGVAIPTQVSAADPLPVVQTGTPTLPADAATATNQTAQITKAGAGLPASLASGGGLLVQDGPTELQVGVVLQDATNGTKNGDELVVTGYADTRLVVSSGGAMGGTIAIEVSANHSQWWDAVVASGSSPVLAPSASVTQDGHYFVHTAGFRYLRARFIAVTGTVTVTGYTCVQSSPMSVQAASLMGHNGTGLDMIRVANIRKDMSAVTITTITTLWTPTSGKKFRLMGGILSVSAACSVLLEDNSAGAGNFIVRTPKLAADAAYNFDLGNGFLSAAANNLLKGTSSAAAAITGTLYGTEE